MSSIPLWLQWTVALSLIAVGAAMMAYAWRMAAKALGVPAVEAQSPKSYKTIWIDEALVSVPANAMLCYDRDNNRMLARFVRDGKQFQVACEVLPHDGEPLWVPFRNTGRIVWSSL